MVVLQGRNQAGHAARSRRSLYVLARRNYHLSLLGVFDQPTMSSNCPNRQQSAVVSQSLAMLNDETVIDAAEKFAARVVGSTTPGDSAAQIRQSFRIALGRDPSAKELSWSQELLSQHAAELAPTGLNGPQLAEKALSHLCHMLLSANEFLYLR